MFALAVKTTCRALTDHILILGSPASGKAALARRLAGGYRGLKVWRL
jgi:hypothetical protein